MQVTADEPKDCIDNARLRARAYGFMALTLDHSDIANTGVCTVMRLTTGVADAGVILKMKRFLVQESSSSIWDLSVQ